MYCVLISLYSSKLCDFKHYILHYILNLQLIRYFTNTTFRQFHQHFTYEFFLQTSFRQLFSSYVLALGRNSYKKFARKTLMKLTPWQQISHFSKSHTLSLSHTHKNTNLPTFSLSYTLTNTHLLTHTHTYTLYLSYTLAQSLTCFDNQ